MWNIASGTPKCSTCLAALSLPCPHTRPVFEIPPPLPQVPSSPRLPSCRSGRLVMSAALANYEVVNGYSAALTSTASLT